MVIIIRRSEATKDLLHKGREDARADPRFARDDTDGSFGDW
jgi:hypothetical protein